MFGDVMFLGRAMFADAAFAKAARFDKAVFNASAMFDRATFNGDTTFSGATAALARDHAWPDGWHLEVSPEGEGQLAPDSAEGKPSGDT
ncbi:pentapeptide repeat-containing protein [Microbispora sp. NPDC046973]|uniref:pentapeptide repeat-containing protein n=1 Tax=Microbispora sp. NPDC046973 TaxID=3155022 RepID=UPI0033D191A8